MIASVKIYRGTVVIDYIYKRNHLRETTGITKVSKDELRKGILISKVADAESKNKIILVKLKQVNTIIDDYYMVNKEWPSINHVKEKIKENKQSTEIKEKNFNDYYIAFFKKKKSEAISPTSLKDYKSTQNALLTYDKVEKKLSLEVINSADFIEKFELFLSKSSPSDEFGFIGNQCNNTIRKRITCLKTFLKWCEGKEFLKRKFDVENYKSKIQKFKPTIVVLTREEQIQLKDLKLSGRNEKLRDVMLFLCYTGLRYSDLLTLVKDDCKEGFITKDAEKTRVRFRIPLNKNSMEILEKYNYRLDFFSTKDFNVEIKKLLEDNDICKYPIEIRDVKYNKIVRSQVMKFDVISSHTGRRSFVARCLQNGFGLTEIMSFTGHKKVDTLMIYVDVFQNQESAQERFKMLEI
jgi:integrase